MNPWTRTVWVHKWRCSHCAAHAASFWKQNTNRAWLFTWNSADGLLTALLGGVLGGLLWMAIWWLFAIPVLSISLSGLFLGFLVAAVLLFTPLGLWPSIHIYYSYHRHPHRFLMNIICCLLGEVAFLQSSLSYWVFVSCIMLLPTVLLLPQARLVSVLTRSAQCTC